MNDFSEADLIFEPERYELQSQAAFPIDRREFLRWMGGGLVVLCLARESEAFQQPNRGGRRGGSPAPRIINAWLHIAQSGIVTGYTGKAEVGQNIRTSLAQAVAEELRIPLASVVLVMGDTAKTPYDMGTFGSRTTPSMAPQLRRAAVAAREALLDLAAERLKVDRSALAVVDGTIAHPPTNRSFGFGELTHGEALLKSVAEESQLSDAKDWKIAGHSALKVNGRAFVTGKHQYVSDMKRPGMLWGKILRAPQFGASLASLDTSQADTIGEVQVVRDGEFVAVVAPDEPTASRGLALLRPVWNPSNEASSDTSVFAEFAKALNKDSSTDQQDAGASIESTYTVAYIAHAPLEPRAALAEWEGDSLTVWTGTQRPFGVRSELAQALRIPEEKVRVIVPDTGSGYGGKHTGEAAIEAARIARVVGKPIKRVWTREEEFTWAYFRPAGLIKVKASAGKDGILTSWDFQNVNSGGSGLETPYEVKGKHVAFHQARSPLRQGSYRALASTANHFARESAMDDLARIVSIDPLKFRLKNLKNERIKAVLHAAADRFEWKGRKTRPEVGFGIACGTEKGSYVATCAEIAIDPGRDGLKVVRLVTAYECGAIINPDQLKNQVEGALIMGLGGTLFEAINFDGGKILNARFSRYRVPRFSDMPFIDVVLLDRKDLPSAGAGETPIIAVAPAIANAICNAVGMRIRTLPLIPSGLKNTLNQNVVK